MSSPNPEVQPSTRDTDEKQVRAVPGTAGTPFLEEPLEVASKRRLHLSKESRAEGSEPQIRKIFGDGSPD